MASHNQNKLVPRGFGVLGQLWNVELSGYQRKQRLPLLELGEAGQLAPKEEPGACHGSASDASRHSSLLGLDG